ncbi:hypothetical protein PM082_004500 [Marasmius tenuissimus]|nr:hypothetical protein PM082_004500 [Marasmius tenuissimus]
MVFMGPLATLRMPNPIDKTVLKIARKLSAKSQQNARAPPRERKPLFGVWNSLSTQTTIVSSVELAAGSSLPYSFSTHAKFNLSRFLKASSQ